MNLIRRVSFIRLLWLVALLAIALPAAPLRAQDSAPAELEYPLAVAAHESEIFVADRNVPGIWKIDQGKLQLYFQGQKKLRTPLNAPRSLAVDCEGRLLAGCTATREVYRFGADNQPVALTAGGIGIPMGIAVNRAGELLVSDLELHTIWKVPAEGGKPEEFVKVQAPHGVYFDGDDRLWVVSHGDKGALLRISPDQKIEAVVPARAFRFGHDVVVDDEGTAYVSDGYAATVWKIGAGGKPEAWTKGDPLKSPTGLARQGDTLLVADPLARAVFRIGADGKAEALEFSAGSPPE